MENTILCPKCGSSEVEKRNHEQQLTKIGGGVLLSSAGATAGTVGGAASGPLLALPSAQRLDLFGVIMGGTIGTFVAVRSVLV